MLASSFLCFPLILYIVVSACDNRQTTIGMFRIHSVKPILIIIILEHMNIGMELHSLDYKSLCYLSTDQDSFVPRLRLRKISAVTVV